MRQRIAGNVLVAVACVCAGRAARAQEIELDGIVIGGDAPPQAATAAGAAPAAPPSERAKLLAQLKFDRRPSAILAARTRPAGADPAPGAPAAPGAASEAPSLGEPFVMIDTAGVTMHVVTSSGGVVQHSIAGVPAVAAAGAEAKAEPAPEAAAPPDPEAAAAAAAAAEAKAAEQAALKAEMTTFQRDVTLGDWAAVKTYLAGIPEADGKAGYERLVASLVEGPPKPQSPFANWAEKNFLAVEDVVGLVAAAPVELDRERVTALGKLARACSETSGLRDALVAALRDALAADALGVERTKVAALLIAAGFPLEAGEFLPPLEEARASDDRATLNLVALHCLARHEAEKPSSRAQPGEVPDGGWLEQAWHALQAALASGTVSAEDEAEALKRAVELAPRLADELGAAWLEESFTARPERGLQILAAIGTGASTGLVDQARDADYRLKSLTLQTTAAEALLAEAPELAEEWRDTLALLAQNWLREAEYAYQNDRSTARTPGIQRDAYGNVFFMDWGGGMRDNPNQPASLKTTDVLLHRPSDAWLARVGSGLAARIARVLAQLHLKIGEEAEAFPHIEALAASHPAHAEELCTEFLRVWIRNHDPNSQQQRSNPYVYIYGFEERANGIPLTRSKQERNLAELAGWIARLRGLAGVELDEKLVAQAFTTAHSSAEVYRLETIERVFGALGGLGPKTLAELAQTMRTNLAGVWREPATQEEKKTRRRQQDIQAEVLHGYEVASTVVERALADHPGEWGLLLARAALLHDENDYRTELVRSSEYVPKRAEAFAEFARAAEAYAARVPELDLDEQTSEPYELWFYAALGACDLRALDHRQQTATGEMERVRASLEALGGEVAERHADLFANALFTRLSSVAPAVKYRYLRHGLEIVPASERTREARKVFDYYSDLVTEIRLEARVDGSTRVGTEPFGVFVDLRHTREIEREAGGFSKYLVNQNAQSFAWNYGRPTEDYRDKFEEAARAALTERFEVLSVTFNSPEAHSRALDEYGWRVTPYAYLLLKARGPEVDRLPPLRMDLDFLDTSGYAVLPIESAALALDAARAPEEPRPFVAQRIVQTLDERRAGEKQLVLEVQARGRGLVPELDELLDLAHEGFELAGIEDQGVSVAQFDQEAEGIDVVSERTWLVSLRGLEGVAELPSEFRFGAPRVAADEVAYQRFVDADVASVGPVVALEERYGERAGPRWWPWAVALVVAVLAGVTGLGAVRRRRRAPRAETRFRIPASLTPFTVLALLREIAARGALDPNLRAELDGVIASLEARYFAEDAEVEEDLAALAQKWVRCAG